MKLHHVADDEDVMLSVEELREWLRTRETQAEQAAISLLSFLDGNCDHFFVTNGKCNLCESHPHEGR